MSWRRVVPAVAGMVAVAVVGWGVMTPASAAGCVIPTGSAHRGGPLDYGRTEDTIKAYAAVGKSGIRDWETDIHFGLHGGAVLMHDGTIDRTTRGSGAVASMDTGRSTVRMNDGQKLADQTLRNLLALASQEGATVAIEPKVKPTASEVTKVLALLDKYGMRDHVVLNSFQTSHLAPFKAVAPDLTYALTTTTYVEPSVAAAVGPIIKINRAALTPARVDAYHAAGVRVDESVDNVPGTWAAHRNWGVDRIGTDRPTAYRGWRDWVCTHEKWPAS